ncbi:MAG: mechanosensitive ion channel domain-containing protein [Elainellaceae cyanobacterium]
MMTASIWSPRVRLFFLLLAALLSLLLGLTPISAGSQTRQANQSDTAPIMVDGRIMVRVGSIEGFSAENRAANANRKINQALASTPPDEPIQVKPTQQGDLTTLRINDRHLLTITEGDFIPGITPMEQAEEWGQVLEDALHQAQRERTAAYRRRAWLISIGLIGLAIALHGLVHRLRRLINRQTARRSSTSSPSSSHWVIAPVIQPLLICVQFGVWIAALIYFTGLFPQSRYWRYRTLTFLQEALTEPIFDLGERGYSIFDILKIVVLALLLWIGVRGITLLVRSRLLRVIGADQEIQDAIALSMQFLLTGIGLLIILQGLGFDVSSLAILASVLGVSIGFGLQNIASNFTSGLIILFERPIRVGDFVNLGELVGTVERIGARSTEIRTLDYVTIIVPNSEFIDSKVVNWSHGHPVSRLHVPFGVAYGSHVKQVRASVLEAVKIHPEVLRYPQPQIWFQGFGESSLDFDALVWIRDPRHQFRIRSDLYYLIEANFRRYHIEIPFPQRDLHVRSPQIDDLISLWAGRDSSLPILSTSTNPLDSSDSQSELQPASDDLLTDLIECSILLRQKGDLPDSELDRLVSQLRGEQGIEIKDRRYGLRIYAQCFVGSEAVDWLMNEQKATRDEAIRIGKILVERGIIHHVTDEHTFEDQYLFYRFYADECDTLFR